MELPGCGEASVEAGDAHAKFSCDDGQRSIVALMAGAAAEQVLFNSIDEVGCRVDMQRVRRRLERCGYHDGGSELWTYTLDFVRPHLGAITFLASVLQRERVLDGETITAIVDACVEG
jgi:hypothetical protein